MVGHPAWRASVCHHKAMLLFINPLGACNELRLEAFKGSQRSLTHSFAFLVLLLTYTCTLHTCTLHGILYACTGYTDAHTHTHIQYPTICKAYKQHRPSRFISEVCSKDTGKHNLCSTTVTEVRVTSMEVRGHTVVKAQSTIGPLKCVTGSGD